jgi:nitrite reductase/ring-hydroxylating ferredoxin subunit
MSEQSDWVWVASVDSMRPGEGFDTGREVDGEVVGLFLIDGAYYATGECTHEKGPLCQGQREGVEITCPWHSAKFNLATGECLQGPVACRTDGSVEMGNQVETCKVESLVRYEVRVEGKDILVRRKRKEGPSLKSVAADPDRLL